MWEDLLQQLNKGDTNALARAISLVENQVPGYEKLLSNISVQSSTAIIGITGPPGAGKSTLTDALIASFVQQGERVAILCVDPSSPFTQGAILGDRIRMNQWYNHPAVFIRSLASRGALGGLHPMVVEITDLLKAARFDKIIVETVGVGQSEIEIVGLADVTIVVLVPEAGDEIQTMKSGLMEVADIFVVNKCDRPGSDQFSNNLQAMLDHSTRHHQNHTAIIKTIAAQQQGIELLQQAITDFLATHQPKEKLSLLAERAMYLIAKRRMKDLNKQMLADAIQKEGSGFNLYQFIEQF